MPTQMEMLLEADRRGLLPPDKKAMLDEAMRRGLIEGLADAPPIPSPVMAPQEPISGTEAFSRAAVEKMLTNVLGLPETTVNMVIGGLTAPFVGDPRDVPQVSLGAPSGQEALAAAQTAIQRGMRPGFQEPFEENLAAQEQRSIRAREDAPIASGAGDIAADIATLALVRKPFKASELNVPAISKASQTVLGRIMQSVGRSVSRTGGRALETGLEGAFLASLQDGDPATIGAIGAGTQVAGDILRPAVKSLLTPKGLLSAVGVATLVSLGVQQLTPGGLDRVLPTLEGRNKEAFFLIALGGTTALLTGRVPKDFAGPAFAELGNVAKSGVLFSALNSVVSSPDRVPPVLQKFSEDPDFFGPEAKRRLTRALNREDIDLSNTVDGLMKNRAFRRLFESLQGGAQ